MRPKPLGARLMLLVLSGCASGLQRPVRSLDAVTDAGGVQRLELDMHTWYFVPNRIVVHAGRPVEITLVNRSLVVPHNFTVSDPAIAVSVDKWGPGHARVRFTPKAAGEYAFHCDEHGHAKHGMTGTLVVLP